MSDATEVKGMVAADAPDTSLLDFYRTMSVKGRRTFWAATGGWTLDGMDFMLFPLAIGTLATVLHSDMKTMGGIVSVTVLCSAVGGWFSGYLSDRIGRVRTMQITILLFSLGSLLSAFAQDVTQLTLARMVLGFLLRERAQLHQAIDQRLIPRQLDHAPFGEMISPAIADVADDDVPAIDVHGLGGAAHAAPL